MKKQSKKKETSQPEDKQRRKSMPPREIDTGAWEGVPSTFIPIPHGTMNAPVLPEQLRDVHENED